MRLERLFIHHLIRSLRLVIPVVIVLLALVSARNYFKQRGLQMPPQEAQKLPTDLSMRTEGFTFSRTEGGKTKFTIHAGTNLGFKDNKDMLQDVDVTVYGANEDARTRRIRSNVCSYDEQSNDIRFEGDVRLQLDDRTSIQTEELAYNHHDRIVVSSQRVAILQEGSISGHADGLTYGLDTGLLKLTGNVQFDTEDEMTFQAGSATFQEKENWVTAEGGLSVRSRDGWLRGLSGRAELEPERFRPKAVVVEGAATAELQASTGRDSWKIKADRMEALISPEGNLARIQADGKVAVEKRNGDQRQQLGGSEVLATFLPDGKLNALEAHGNARMVFGSDQILEAGNIFTDATGSVQTMDRSVLRIGDSTIEGAQFRIQQGDIVSFSTNQRARLHSGERTTSADRTEARFDSRTNSLVELVQSGNFKFQEGQREGEAQNAHFEDAGNTIVLDGSPVVTDSEARIQAGQIRLDQRNSSFVAVRNVKTLTKRSDEPVLVTAGRVEGKADSLLYMDDVQLWRANAYVQASRLEIFSHDNSLHAEGDVQSNIGQVRALCDKLDYDDAGHIAHYAGNVRAQRKDMVLRAGNMILKLRDKDVEEITITDGVVVEQGSRQGLGDKGVYDAATQSVTLTGQNAEVRDTERGVVRGSRLVMKTNGDSATVEGGSNQSVTRHTIEE